MNNGRVRYRIDLGKAPHDLVPGPKIIDSDPETEHERIVFYDDRGNEAPFIKLVHDNMIGGSLASDKNLESLERYLKKYNKNEFRLVDESLANINYIKGKLDYAKLVGEVSSLLQDANELSNLCIVLNIFATNEKEAQTAILAACEVNPDAVRLAMNSDDRHLIVTHRKAVNNRVVITDKDGKMSFDNGSEIVNLGTTETAAIEYYKLNEVVYKAIIARLNGHTNSPVETFTKVIEDMPEVDKALAKEEKLPSVKDLFKKAESASLIVEGDGGSYLYNDMVIGSNKAEAIAFLTKNISIQKAINKYNL